MLQEEKIPIMVLVVQRNVIERCKPTVKAFKGCEIIFCRVFNAYCMSSRIYFGFKKYLKVYTITILYCMVLYSEN